MSKQDKTVMIENAELLFLNFSGNEGKFNRKGDKHFSVILPEDVAVQMESDGWNVKWLEPREEGDDPTPIIQVALGYKFRPPQITMITSTSRVNLTEDMVEILDNVEIENVDLIFRAREWTMDSGKSGIKAYLQTMFVTVFEDELQKKYSIVGEE